MCCCSPDKGFNFAYAEKNRIFERDFFHDKSNISERNIKAFELLGLTVMTAATKGLIAVH